MGRPASQAFAGSAFSGERVTCVRKIFQATAVLGVLAACQTGAGPDPAGIGQEMGLDLPLALPSGSVPKMGGLSGTLGEAAVAWETFDFSVGAYDASSAVYDFNGETRLSVVAMRPSQPRSDAFRFRLVATSTQGWLTTGLPVGEIPGPIEVVIERGETDTDTAQMVATSAVLVLETATPPPTDGYPLGHITGTLRAQVCPVDWPGRECAPLVVRIDTDVQFGG